ncbi:endonuclease/exonuclease/phosphatase family protein [Dechloromonas sp. XY25]|uniref:Endonuclease/exonuclease/phosphatase family protein n=1 Tax=Dechloromonas hankyongensis TaxID=2908002 RepID=A0ABS9K6I9_9RHOO|nr:endonuclease/exonuclease/phosphatase family protein [Dechloromonas hankyongensis]MCG2578753.1 endonuclease/exonuclease/phosphatase family protein [Dechloromonas hankyongensis]
MNQDTELVSWHNLDELLGPDCLRIASYNIHRCAGTDGRTDAARVAGIIDEIGCDTIGLQEVASDQDGRHDSVQLDYLAERTHMQAIPGHTIVNHTGHFGNALLTRRPVLAVRQHDLSVPQREPRGAIEADLDIDGLVVRVFVTHLGLRPGERRYQVRKMLDLLHDVPPERPVIVLGDINEWLPIGRPLRWLHGLLGQAPAERSFPARWPIFALDRVWVRPYWALLAFGTHRTAGARIASDHLPVKAIIAAKVGAERDGGVHRPNRRRVPRTKERNAL